MDPPSPRLRRASPASPRLPPSPDGLRRTSRRASDAQTSAGEDACAEGVGVTPRQKGEGGTAGDGARAARAKAASERGQRHAGVDWDEVRRAYELTNETVPAIRKRFGLSVHDLRARRIAEAWTARPPIAQPGKLPRRVPAGADALQLKLNKLLVVGVAMLEKRLADEGMTEGNARTLTELCRAEEIRMRSKRNEKAAKARETKKHDAGYDFRDDPAWLDAEIDRRHRATWRRS